MFRSVTLYVFKLLCFTLLRNMYVFLPCLSLTYSIPRSIRKSTIVILSSCVPRAVTRKIMSVEAFVRKFGVMYLYSCWIEIREFCGPRIEFGVSSCCLSVSDLMGRFLRITVYKRWSRVGVWTGTLKNSTKCLALGARPYVQLFQSACTSMCRHIYN